METNHDAATRRLSSSSSSPRPRASLAVSFKKQHLLELIGPTICNQTPIASHNDRDLMTAIHPKKIITRSPCFFWPWITADNTAHLPPTKHHLPNTPNVLPERTLHRLLRSHAFLHTHIHIHNPPTRKDAETSDTFLQHAIYKVQKVAPRLKSSKGLFPRSLS